MAKPSKEFKKQADRADAAANFATDPDHAANLKALADGLRAQADALKAKDKKAAKSKNIK